MAQQENLERVAKEGRNPQRQHRAVPADHAKEDELRIEHDVLGQHHRRQHEEKQLVLVPVALAAILVLAVVGDGILNREWLSGSSTDDEQQYTIQGQSIDPGLVEESIAPAMTILPIT